MNNYKDTLLRSLTFVVAYLAIFGISMHVKWMQKTTLILLPLVAIFIILFVSEARSKIKQSFGYETVWRGCFLFSFLSGFSWSIPFIIFGESVNGPHVYSIIDRFLLSLGGVVSGGIIGLIGIILINQFYSLLGGADKR